MGGSSSSQSRQVKQPQDIGEFRMLPGPTNQYVIPEVPEKRKTTDFKFTITFAVCIALLVPFLIYTFVHSDLNRIARGFDMCGNVCGKNNTKVDGISCSGQDKRNEPLLKYSKINHNTRFEIDTHDSSVTYECVETCDASNYVVIMNRCFPETAKQVESEEFENMIVADISKSTGYIVALCFIGFGLSVLMMVLFRYCVAVVVWVILIGSIAGFVALTIVFWYIYNNSDTNDKGLQYIAIFFTVLSVILVIMLICMIKRIKLVIRLFKEAIKVIFAMPIILFEPLLTLLAITILLIIFVFFWVVFATSGILQAVRYDLYDFVPNGPMLFTMFFHSVICLWMLQFIIGCQHMVISGAVSAYYFARDKSTLRAPIYNSFYNLIKYHLGTVAFGSLILTIITLIKALVRSLANSRQTKILVDCCLGYIEDFLKFLSKNAYIQTAMHGQPFFKSGKRAVRLLAANFISTLAVNSVGDFVLNMAKLLIIVATVGIGIWMRDDSIQNFGVAIFISAVVTALIANCFFTVFETAVDTIFLCYCEDSLLNDGMERPYYMTTNLMQYIEDAKKTVKDKDRR